MVGDRNLKFLFLTKRENIVSIDNSLDTYYSPLKHIDSFAVLLRANTWFEDLTPDSSLKIADLSDLLYDEVDDPRIVCSMHNLLLPLITTEQLFCVSFFSANIFF